MIRECGACTMCCKLLGVPDMPDGSRKPPGKWCPHCAIGNGCTIYADRPETCRDFECVWLQDTQNLMGEDMRPDRLHVVFTPTNDGCGLIAHCPPDRPHAWQQPRVIKLLHRCAQAGYPATARCLNRHWIIGVEKVWQVPESAVIETDTGLAISIPDEVMAQLGLSKGTFNLPASGAAASQGDRPGRSPQKES